MSLAACGGARAPAPVENRLPATAVDYLVWTANDQGASTMWLSSDGEARGSAAGIVTAGGDRLGKPEPPAPRFPLRPCDEIDHDPPLPPSGAGEQASGRDLAAVPLDGGATLALGEPVADEGSEELEWTTA